MGYSARYHAASLAAVFLALGVGILIGVGFGDTVASRAKKDIASSLSGDLKDARARADDLRDQARRQAAFERQVYPALVRGKLRASRIGLIALGGLPEGITSDVREALEPSGARLTEVAVVRAPPDIKRLEEGLRGTRFERLDRDPGVMVDLGERVGSSLVRGSGFVRRMRSRVLSRASGPIAPLDGAILVRDRPEGLDPGDRQALDRFERGLFKGIRSEGLPAVGVEGSDQEHSTVGFFEDRRLSSVDSIDITSGRVALVFALAGAEGAFGIKSSADQLLPEPLAP